MKESNEIILYKPDETLTIDVRAGSPIFVKIRGGVSLSGYIHALRELWGSITTEMRGYRRQRDAGRKQPFSDLTYIGSGVVK